MAQTQFLANGNKRTALAYLYVFLINQNIYIGTNDIFNDSCFVANFEKLALETASKYKHSIKMNKMKQYDIKITNVLKKDNEIYEDLYKFLMKNAKIEV
ncbi:hypothetical protein SLITO_v1c06460 [Spiroplasma litorale]|uniref:Uncharacterized protein n=1 Tax=Spiroplasma litorale TaxID=216942 RepID=A0A0K1W1T8_9MOLU|nr:hypothetical protein [Spiroplasma litorale]AKX34275.1 hypothetical protein SLITO_v1c06460 [Spiroplasma litorale]